MQARTREMCEVFNVVNELKESPVGFSELSHRKRKDILKPANEVLDLFLDKVIGDDVRDQGRYLLSMIKRLFPRGKYKEFIVNEFESLEDYSSLDRKKRQIYGRHSYKVFDEILKKVSGSEDPETHRQFMSARFRCIHKNQASYEPLIKEPF